MSPSRRSDGTRVQTTSELLDPALEAAGLAVAAVSLEGSLLAATSSFAERVGRRLEGLPGTALADVVLGHERVGQLLEDVRRGMAAGAADASPVAERRRDAVFWAVVRDTGGVATHLHVVLAAEAVASPAVGGQAAALLEHAADATWTADSEGTVLSITSRMLAEYGLAPQDVVGTSVFDWIAPEDAAAFRSAWDAVVRQASSHEVVECRLALPGRQVTWVQERLTDLRDDPNVGAICGNVIDISHRRLREQRRELQERRLRAGFEQSGIPQGVLSTQGRFVEVNGALCSLLDRSRETLLGMHVQEITHPADAGRANQVLGRLISGAVEAAQAERVLIGPGGRPLPVLVDTAVLRDDTGAVDAVVGHLMDLSPLRDAERRRQQQEEFFLALSTNASELVLVSDAEAQILYVSAALQNVLGYEGHDVVGSVGFSFVHPEDEGAARDAYQEVVSRGGTRTYVVRVIAADGSWHSMEATATNLTHTSLGGIVTNMRDITDRVALEAELALVQQRYRDVFEATSLGLLVITPDAEILEANQAVCRLLGYTREELLQRRSTDLVVGSALTLEERQQRVATRGPTGYEIEEVMLRRDGTVLPVLLTVNVIQPPVGAAGQISLVVRDQSRLKELQAQLLRSERLEAAGRVAAGVVHDTNNILAAVSGYAELLADAVAGQPTAEQHLAGIRRSIQRANDMVAQLLAFTRGQHLAAAEVDLREVVEDLEEMLQRLMPDGVRLLVDAQPAPTVADVSQVRQVVLNLLVNARDAVATDGTVRLSTGVLDIKGDDVLKQGRYAVLTVADDGAGMDEAVAHRCFEPFFSTRSTHGGTGLGLSTAHGIAQQSGGDLRVRTAPGQGAEFQLLLPAAGVGTPTATDVRPHVLVAEDDSDFRSVLVQALQRTGYTVTEAEDGRAALATGVLPDLLVTDLDMPNLDGLGLTRALRNRREDLPVLFVSGGASVPSLPGARFLRKPFPMVALLQAVAAALGERSPQR